MYVITYDDFQIVLKSEINFECVALVDKYEVLD